MFRKKYYEEGEIEVEEEKVKILVEMIKELKRNYEKSDAWREKFRKNYYNFLKGEIDIKLEIYDNSRFRELEAVNILIKNSNKIRKDLNPKRVDSRKSGYYILINDLANPNETVKIIIGLGMDYLTENYGGSWEDYNFLQNKIYQDAVITLKSEGKTFSHVNPQEPVVEINLLANDVEEKMKNVINEYKTIIAQYPHIMRTYLEENQAISDTSGENQNLFEKYIYTILKKEKDIKPKKQKNRMEENSVDAQNISEVEPINHQIYGNFIYYGAPGCGKSYQVKQIVEKKENFADYERVLFHPEYSYSDFVGQILPTVAPNQQTIQYIFKAGPFTRILGQALRDQCNHYCLLIEEINRGNASAIFGDIFQLMDRDKNGKSEYPITNQDIIEWLIKEQIIPQNKRHSKIYIPRNLSIYATMNTSDQNVYILDTAFKRRWKLKYVEINFQGENEKIGHQKIDLPNGQEVTWKDFVTTINAKIPILNNGVNAEDKLIGQRFVLEEELQNRNDFAQKVLLYLWNDVAKTNRKQLFDIEEKKINTLGDLIANFKKDGMNIFVKEIRAQLGIEHSDEEEENENEE